MNDVITLEELGRRAFLCGRQAAISAASAGRPLRRPAYMDQPISLTRALKHMDPDDWQAVTLSIDEPMPSGEELQTVALQWMSGWSSVGVG